uniref:Uncharacterized protein n=1 Tax=Rhizophora mucronata TaxID=61149 RepID=A0A2P2NEX0_RHIMU
MPARVTSYGVRSS